ncbi:MAG: LLM class flavin-dependent oxidoreductase [Chloroflexi bacterium]|nr:LLM class flavin-dependent oxidoreductase [Chloroflexota bacterium]
MKVGVLLPMGNHGSPPDPWPTVLAFGQRAEAVGLDGLWIVDHTLFRLPDQPERGIHEAWSILAAMAASTQRIGIGTLVLGLRFRNAALLAKMAATTDEIAGGRLTLGVGAGWHDPEYESFGYPLDHRIGRSEEAFRLLVTLIREGRATQEGRWVSAHDAAILPAARPDMRILSAARGGRMMDVVARHADAANVAWVGRPSDPMLVERMAALDAACERAGRDPASLERTVGISIRYPNATTQGPSPDPTRNLDGSLDDPRIVADGLRAFAEAGYTEAMVWLEPMDIGALDRLAESVALLRV